MSGSHASAIKAYVQRGQHRFHSHSRELRAHMHAAFLAGQAPPLPDPGVTGQLDDQSIQMLWQIFSFVGSNWSLGSPSLDFVSFVNFLNLKTNEAPSYYTVYGYSVGLYQILIDELGPTGALSFLYTPSPQTPPPYWDVVRAWTIQELANLYVNQGAFRSYGWWLYPGFAGGPFSDPQHLPYRAAPQ